MYAAVSALGDVMYPNVIHTFNRYQHYW